MVDDQKFFRHLLEFQLQAKLILESLRHRFDRRIRIRLPLERDFIMASQASFVENWMIQFLGQYFCES